MLCVHDVSMPPVGSDDAISTGSGNSQHLQGNYIPSLGAPFFF